MNRMKKRCFDALRLVFRRKLLFQKRFDKKTTFFFFTTNFFQVILEQKTGIFSLFFCFLFRVKKRNFQHDRARARSRTFWKAICGCILASCIFYENVENHCFAKFTFSQIFSVIFFRVSGFNRLNRACARTWLFLDHVGCEKSLFWGFSSDYGTIFRSFCQNSSFKEQF